MRETEHREAGRACRGSSLTGPWTLGLPWGCRRAWEGVRQGQHGGQQGGEEERVAATVAEIERSGWVSETPEAKDSGVQGSAGRTSQRSARA